VELWKDTEVEYSHLLFYKGGLGFGGQEGQSRRGDIRNESKVLGK
jgi:hypothetical protein